MEFESVLLIAGLALYGTATVAYMWFLLRGSEAVKHWAGITAAIGLACHTCAVAYLTSIKGMVSFYHIAGALLFVSWAAMALYLWASRRHKVAGLGSAICLIVSSALVFVLVLPHDMSVTPSITSGNRWSVLNIVASLLGYAGFMLAFTAGVAHMFQQRMLKTKHIRGFQKRMPSLDATDQFAYRMVTIGFFMQTLGIVAGSLWASTALGRFWDWSGKETWSLATWLVYAVYLHIRGIAGWHGKWANRLLIIGFCCVLVTFFGASLAAKGLHWSCW